MLIQNPCPAPGFPSQGAPSSAHPQAHPEGRNLFDVFPSGCAHTGWEWAKGRIPLGKEGSAFPPDLPMAIQSSKTRKFKPENKRKMPQNNKSLPCSPPGKGGKQMSQKGKTLTFGNKNNALNRANHPNPKADSSCLNPIFEAEKKSLAQADTLQSTSLFCAYHEPIY